MLYCYVTLDMYQRLSQRPPGVEDTCRESHETLTMSTGIGRIGWPTGPRSRNSVRQSDATHSYGVANQHTRPNKHAYSYTSPAYSHAHAYHCARHRFLPGSRQLFLQSNSARTRAGGTCSTH